MIYGVCKDNRVVCPSYDDVYYRLFGREVWEMKFEEINKNGNLAIGCMVCGESIALTEYEEMKLFGGGMIQPKICEDCKKAILWAKAHKAMEKRI